MKTFVEFIQEREKQKKRKAYLSAEFTVLALYAEYIAWLAKNDSESHFTLSQLLAQLKIINRYQIYLLTQYSLTNNLHKPIVLNKVPSYIADIAESTENEILPQAITQYTRALPPEVNTEIRNTRVSITKELPWLQLTIFLSLLVPCFLSFFFVYHIGLPPLAKVILEPLCYAFLFGALVSTDDNRFPQRENYDTLWRTGIFIAIGLACVIPTAILSMPPTLSSIIYGLGATILAISSWIELVLLFAHTEGIFAEKVKPRLVMDRLATLNDQTHRPLIDLIKKPDQPNNQLKEATTATVNCFLASRNSAIPDNETVSIQTLNRRLNP